MMEQTRQSVIKIQRNLKVRATGWGVLAEEWIKGEVPQPASLSIRTCHTYPDHPLTAQLAKLPMAAKTVNAFVTMAATQRVLGKDLLESC